MQDYQKLYDKVLAPRDLDLVAERQSELSYDLMQEIAAEAELQGLSASALAKLMGRDRSTVSRWLSGSANLALETIALFEKALGRPLVQVNGRASMVFAAGGMHDVPRGVEEAEVSGQRLHAQRG